MTQAIDKFLVDHGFECQELRNIRHRSILYLAILTAALSAFTFFSLAIAAWT